MMRFRVGVDVGGTFTDIVFLSDEGTVLATKIASTPDNYSVAVLAGIEQGLARLEIDPDAISEVNHGFTIATNAILEGKGARTALITTEGFRDILEFRRNRVPRLYDFYYEKPPALVKRQLRFEVRERLNFRGEVLQPLDMQNVEEVIERIIRADVESVVVCLLHSYANPDHEQCIAQGIRRRAPNLTVTLSSELLPVMKEYERTSTTVINGYVRPVVEQYLGHLTTGLRALGVNVPLAVMQSTGGLATPRMASERPAFCIESGPAAGVMGAFHVSQRLGMANVMVLDMGGTTAKAAIIENGQILQSQEYEVGAGLNAGHRLLRGAGHILSVPAIDLAEVGAGGGSIASVDNSKSLRVGPRSSGAVPGPACYGRGGFHATVTDANVLLGYLNPQHLLGGDFVIDLENARRAVSEHVAAPLGLSEIDAVHGVHLLANSNMSRALKAVSSERGRDPRRFDLVAFGGSGPVHASGLAAMLEISRIIIPAHPGVFSAFGLLFPDVEHHLIKTYFKAFDNLDVDIFNNILADMWEEARQILRSERFDDSCQELVTQVDIKYEGQGSGLTVPMPPGQVTSASLKNLADAFDVEHEKTFGHCTDAPYQLVNIRVVARGLSAKPRFPEKLRMISASRKSDSSQRSAYFGSKHGWIDTPLINRTDLDERGRDGPLLIEEYDSTTVIPPMWRACVDERKNIVLETT